MICENENEKNERMCDLILYYISQVRRGGAVRCAVATTKIATKKQTDIETQERAAHFFD